MNNYEHKYLPAMTEKEFIMKQEEILGNIPKEFRNALADISWENGHSAGYEEVLNDLQGLVSYLEGSIKAYTDRLLQEKVNAR